MRIASASINENGRASGGAAGDQTGREVYVLSWYSGSWNYVLRPKSRVVAERMAVFAEGVCANNRIGYDQPYRNSLRAQARAVGWDPSRITTNCSCDCSSFMTVCAEAAGVDMNSTYTSGNAPTTYDMVPKFVATGAFEALSGVKYTASPDYLLRGDVIVRTSGHTVMALDNGSKAVVEVQTYDTLPTRYRVATKTDPLNCRAYPGVESAIIGQFAKDSEVMVTKRNADASWLYASDTALSGWVAAEYLKPIVVDVATSAAVMEEKKEVEHMSVSDLTDKECYQIIERAQRYAAMLPQSEWAVLEAGMAVKDGITDGNRPRAFATREEVAVMVYRSANK